MKHEELNRRLEDLHRELAGSAELDEETRKNVQTLMGDISRLMDGNARNDGGGGSPIEAVESQIRALEVQHPKLAAALGRIVDMLSGMGI
ncbi:MAG TPA: DUF4404 family protein [bacterium]|nr:DUF4404 family protein [bacterium]HPJ71910.1 DUF4404 family protein [bacterium]HPQ66286.1 DUF4404 family protein [bacterium]